MTASSVAGSSGSSVTTAKIRRKGGRKSMATRPKDWLEQTATARAVEDRNQEFKSARADVREMEGSLERVRASIAKIARKLAVYVRARLEHSRGRSGPDRGWSR